MYRHHKSDRPYTTQTNWDFFAEPVDISRTDEPTVKLPRRVPQAVAMVREDPRIAVVWAQFAVWIRCPGIVAVALPTHRHTNQVEVLAVILPDFRATHVHGKIELPEDIWDAMDPRPEGVYKSKPRLPTRFPWELPPLPPIPHIPSQSVREANEIGED